MSGILQESFPSVLVLCLCTFHAAHCAQTPRKACPKGEGAAVSTAGSAACLPCPQVNLKKGVPPDSHNETCTAGAGSLLVEFGILSRLLGDSTFEWVARRAVKALWSLRSNNTGLLGNVCMLLCPHLCPSAPSVAVRSHSPCVPRACVELMALWGFPRKMESLKDSLGHRFSTQIFHKTGEWN